MRTIRFFQKTGRKITINGNDTARYDKSKVKCFNCHKLRHFVRECRQPRNQDSRNWNQYNSRRTVNVKETPPKAMVAIDGVAFDWSLMAEDEVSTNMELIAFLDSEPEFEGYGPKTSKSVCKDISNEVKENTDAPLVKDRVSNNKDCLVESPVVAEKKTVVPTVAKIEFVRAKQQEKPFRKPIKYDEIYRERVVSRNNYTRLNYNNSTRKTHPNAHRNMALRAVLMKTGPRLVNIARPVNTAHPKTIVYCARPMSCFSKSAQSTIKRPYQQRKALTNKSFSQTVNTARPRPVNTARPRLVNSARPRPVNIARPRPVNIARPNSAVVNVVRSHSQKEDQGYVDSGCSRHMTGNMSYLFDFKEFDGGYVTFRGGAKEGRITCKGTLGTGKLDFEDVYFVKELKFNLLSASQMCDKKNNVLFTNTGCFVLSHELKLPDESQVLHKVPRRNNMYSVDMKNIVPKESLTCLVAKATLDESMLGHMRLGYINFKNINKLVKDNLVRSLPSKRFENDQTCIAYLKEKQHKASSSKDETSGILKKFITKIENVVDKKVKVIRCDNGSEFKNSVMNDFYAMKGIRREFSVARTPQQNGVAERRNKTLIEATRTMLADSKLPITFWAEAINTACYVQNRVLVVKPHNKTYYELFRGRTPALSFMRPFGCHVTIINTLDHLDKFDGKSDNGFFVGYSLNSNGPKWLFDIDVLTKSMSYVPVVSCTNSNDFVGTKESIDEGHSSKEKGSSQDYIFMPLWKYGSLLDYSLKNASNDEPQPSSDAGHKDNEGVSKESEIDIQEKLENNTQDVNTAEPSINTARTNDNTEVDLRNISNTYLVPFTLNTRIYKDHSLDHMIGDVQSGVLTMRMTKTTNDQGFITTVYEGKTHKDLHTYLFVWTLVDLPYGKRAIGTKWVFRNKKDERGIVIKNKARIEEEAYVCQHLGFEDPDHPDKVYKVVKALYGLHQAPRAWRAHILFRTTASRPMETLKPLLKDTKAEDVDVHLYRSMIGSLMYLIASRPDIIFVVCACARFQVTPKVSHLHAMKRIFRYLKGQPKLGLWYPKDSPLELEAYTDSDYVEYVAAASCCRQVLWIQYQMLDYGYNFMNTKIFINNESTICIVKNPVFHSKTKHIEIRHHFIRDSNEKKLIQMIKIYTDQNVADFLTKAFDVELVLVTMMMVVPCRGGSWCGGCCGAMMLVMALMWWQQAAGDDVVVRWCYRWWIVADMWCGCGGDGVVWQLGWWPELAGKTRRLSEVRKIIHNVRESVKHVGASPGRLHVFSELSKQLLASNKHLILDVSTHWNATYAMLSMTLEFKEVFVNYTDRETSYTTLTNEEDWEKVEEVCSFLGLFNEATKIISGYDYPTSNLFLSELYGIKEELDEVFLDTIGDVLDPRYKMKLIDFSFKDIYFVDEATIQKKIMRDTLDELYDEYVEAHRAGHVVSNANIGSQSCMSNSGLGSTSKTGKRIKNGTAKYDLHIRNEDTTISEKSEIDTYLEEGVYIGEPGVYFDA
nr:zinc finger BED domain-containing protein RICESLEEPER 2-like [Tanacetum cinerariifolium]